MRKNKIYWLAYIVVGLAEIIALISFMIGVYFFLCLIAK